jgi:hypothetical protein
MSFFYLSSICPLCAGCSPHHPASSPPGVSLHRIKSSPSHHPTSTPPPFRPFDVLSLMGRREDASDQPSRTTPVPAANTSSPEHGLHSSPPPPPPPVASLYPYLGFYQHLLSTSSTPPAFLSPAALQPHHQTPPPFQFNPLLLSNWAMNPFLLQAAAYSSGLNTTTAAAPGGTSCGGPITFMERIKQNRYSPYSPPPHHQQSSPPPPPPAAQKAQSPPLSSPHYLEKAAGSNRDKMAASYPPSRPVVTLTESRSAFQSVLPRQQQSAVSQSTGAPSRATDRLPSSPLRISPESSPGLSHNSSPSSLSSSSSSLLRPPPLASASEIKSMEEMVSGLNGSLETKYGIAH